jgi:hypothetical protein
MRREGFGTRLYIGRFSDPRLINTPASAAGEIFVPLVGRGNGVARAVPAAAIEVSREVYLQEIQRINCGEPGGRSIRSTPG